MKTNPFFVSSQRGQSSFGRRVASARAYSVSALLAAVAVSLFSGLCLTASAQTLSASNKEPVETVCFGKPGDPVSCSQTTAPTFDQLEAEVFAMINQDRTDQSTLEETKGQAHPLIWDARLAAVARAHSEEMMQQKFLAHEGADGTMPADRVTKAGIRWLSMGENVARAKDVKQAQTMLMDEPKFEHNHRWNILAIDYTHVGIGVAKGPDGTLYVTEEFARLP